MAVQLLVFGSIRDHTKDGLERISELGGKYSVNPWGAATFAQLGQGADTKISRVRRTCIDPKTSSWTAILGSQAADQGRRVSRIDQFVQWISN